MIDYNQLFVKLIEFPVLNFNIDQNNFSNVNTPS